MKKLLNILCITFALILSVPLFSGCTPKESPVEDFEYQVHNDSTVSITKYIGTDKDIVIPSKIEGMPVLRIFTFAFNYSEIESVYIPDTVTNISMYAFSHSKQLHTVHLGKSVEIIECEAFRGCTSLKTINFPDSLKEIRFLAFAECNSLAEITIPKSVTLMEHQAFAATGLTSITFEDGIKTIGSSLCFWNTNVIDSITIPASVTEIGEYSFNEKLKAVYFSGNAPEKIGESPFKKNTIIYYKKGTTGWDAEVWKDYNLIEQ